MLCFLGIGSNLGDPKKNVERGIEGVGHFQHTTLLACSRLYKTKPVGMESDSWFVNAVLKVETSLNPRRLMTCCLDLEREMGRDRGRGQDRELDLDILYYGNCIVWESDLKIPHPRLAHRAFVLIPWSDVAGGLYIRPWNMTVHALSQQVDRTLAEAIS